MTAYALSDRNKDVLFLGREEAHALDRQGLSSRFLSPEPAVVILPCVGSLRVNEWLKARHSKLLAATSGLRQSELFIGSPSDKLCRDFLAVDRKQCKLVIHYCTETAPTYLGPLSTGNVDRRRNPPTTCFVSGQYWLSID